jgi:hypothetical protein
MKDFSNAGFPPETIDLMKDAMEAAVATLVCTENSNPDVMMVDPQINRHRR